MLMRNYTKDDNDEKIELYTAEFEIYNKRGLDKSKYGLESGYPT